MLKIQFMRCSLDDVFALGTTKRTSGTTLPTATCQIYHQLVTSPPQTSRLVNLQLDQHSSLCKLLVNNIFIATTIQVCASQLIIYSYIDNQTHTHTCHANIFLHKLRTVRTQHIDRSIGYIGLAPLFKISIKVQYGRDEQLEERACLGPCISIWKPCKSVAYLGVQAC